MTTLLQPVSEVYNFIKARLKTLEDISRRIDYGDAVSLLERFQRDMDKFQDAQSSHFPKLNFLAKRPTRASKIFKQRPCKSFVRDIGTQNAYETIFKVLADRMHDSIDDPLNTLVTFLQDRCDICDTRKPVFEIGHEKMHVVCIRMLDSLYNYHSSTSSNAWTLDQDGSEMLKDLRHYRCTGEFDEVAVEKARRLVRGAEYVVMRIGEVAEAMREADEVYRDAVYVSLMD